MLGAEFRDEFLSWKPLPGRGLDLNLLLSSGVGLGVVVTPLMMLLEDKVQGFCRRKKSPNQLTLSYHEEVSEGQLNVL